MNIEQFREFCLSFEQSVEGMPFNAFFKNSKAILVFYAGKKMFCLFDIDSFDRITIRCAAERIEQLKERYAAIEKPINLSHKSWISIKFDTDMPDGKILLMVKDSYHLAIASMTKKERQYFQK
ncbi:putative DNA-binding protein (MmcQ/YjbR family) [Pedobacter sp. W3I1]|uniref:MmcQ/YjbR family DNA-binding protein n=1 Tax=Pedobacter sp. W3I1 TaxID=3042291 RepID=UPI0027873179|nr:MmcQ/YjbR family DNA-binding protein [Pedobacter sp. W3I1]MDQ0639939.1 putative DNA-binding protein (MmcQ/YjbR family) [Pedobacter sp. W3I1]